MKNPEHCSQDIVKGDDISKEIEEIYMLLPWLPEHQLGGRGGGGSVGKWGVVGECRRSGTLGNILI